MSKKDTKKESSTPAEVVEGVGEKIEKFLSRDKNDVMVAKQFVKILKDELKKENISESIYVAFMSSVSKVDTEENYRKIWKNTFRRH